MRRIINGSRIQNRSAAIAWIFIKRTVAAMVLWFIVATLVFMAGYLMSLVLPAAEYWFLWASRIIVAAFTLVWALYMVLAGDSFMVERLLDERVPTYHPNALELWAVRKMDIKKEYGQKAKEITI